MFYAEQIELGICEEEWSAQLVLYRESKLGGFVDRQIMFGELILTTCRKAACVTVPLVAISSDIIKYNIKEQYRDILVYESEEVGTKPKARKSVLILHPP